MPRAPGNKQSPGATAQKCREQIKTAKRWGMPENAIAALQAHLEEAEQELKASQSIGKRIDMAKNKLSVASNALETREEQWMKMAQSVEEAKLEVKEAHAALMELMREEVLLPHNSN